MVKKQSSSYIDEVNILNSEFVRNEAANGGAIFLDTAKLYAVENSFYSNKA